VLVLAAVLAGVVAASARGSSEAAHAATGLTFYTIATGVQYINTRDDRARGAINNPFDPVTNRLSPHSSDAGNGPFPGDVAVYGFALRPTPTSRDRVGTAAVTCYFNYARHALCQAYYQLKGKGTITASGPVDFTKSGFDLIVTGGTQTYLAAHGSLKAVPAPKGTQHVALDLNISTSPSLPKARVTFAKPASAQFMNHADDRLRGMTANPFKTSKSAGLVIVAKGKEKGNGPFPGDDILYTFKLYSNAGLTRKNGTALFTCYYNFVKHATCDAYIAFNDGVVLASGPVVFGSTHFTLGISGGTETYRGANGQIVATPGAKNAERLAVRLSR
jgi:hypothetical protein